MSFPRDGCPFGYHIYLIASQGLSIEQIVSSGGHAWTISGDVRFALVKSQSLNSWYVKVTQSWGNILRIQEQMDIV